MIMQYSQASSNETKTILCIIALCLVKTRWSADFLRAVGLVLEVQSASVDGAITLLYDPIAMHEDGDDEQQQQCNCSMLDRAESMAAGLRSSLTKESAVYGLLRMLFLMVRDGQELAMSWQRQTKKNASDRELVQRMLQLNGRTSVVLRRLALLLRVRSSALAALEEIALREMQQDAKTLLLEQQKVQHLQAPSDERQHEDPNDKNNNSTNKYYSSWIRTAKIGVAATAAGGLLLVTGGLAAPALAAGLAGLGLAGAATLATHTAMAALLGVGGAGLGAYKMSRRTAGLEQFEFQKINATTTRKDNNNHGPPSRRRSSNSSDKEEEEEWNGMTVYICVSGYLRQPGPAPPSSDVPTVGTSTTPTKTILGSSFLFPPSKQQTMGAAASSPDFYGPWGAQPPRMFPSQMLERFYSVVAPDKIKLVPYLLETYEGQEDALMDELAKRYKVHPKSVQQPHETQPDHYVTDAQAAPYRTLIRNFMDQAKGQTPPALVLSEEVLSTLMDSEKPWDKAYLVPKEFQTPELSHEDKEGDIPIDEEMIQKMAEMETTLSEAPTAMKESILMDKETMHNLNEEIELVDLKESRSQSESEGESAVVDTASLQRNEVYWWRKSVAHYGDQYTVIWDPDKLLAIGQCFESLIAEGIQKGISNTLAYTALSAVLSAVALPLQIINLMGMLDESWTLAVEAADEAGKLLADAFLSGMHGNRPVVLIGYSVGGRVVTSCLTELGRIAMGTAAEPSSQQERPDDDDWNDDYSFLMQQQMETDTTIDDAERQRRLRAATIVRDAVIIGAPCGTSSQKWAKRRSVVSGRLINVFSPQDWVLSLLYRYKRFSVIALAGLQEVKLPSAKKKEKNHHRDVLYLSPIENYDVSDIVSTHGDYPAKINEILDRIGIGDVNRETVQSNYFLGLYGKGK
jgi:hypothetical protein